MTASDAFANAVVHWQRRHGRRSLPWQDTRDPYRVWLSEVMLQQTQVATVLGYYQRFLERFPDVQTLASAPQDAVLALWAGLGYYSRARNLHKAAQMVVGQYGGVFPGCAQELAKLPGVGRSTAAAIAAFCFGERVPILDANVRRVLTRFLAFDGDLARPANERALWALASELVPRAADDMPAYTQGLMDLGSSVCTARAPSCLACPVKESCRAFLGGRADQFPVRARKTLRKQESWWLLVLRDDAGRTWLHRRPAPGIWAGLYCTPVFAEEAALHSHLVGWGAYDVQSLLPFRHALTHRELTLHPVCARVSGAQIADAGAHAGAWVSPLELAALGLPAPLQTLLADLD